MSRTYNILVIDDEEDFVEILVGIFKKHDFNAVGMSNAGFAESKIHKDTFDAIIADIKMPFIDGIGLLKSTRKSEANRKTPFFILSAFVDKDALARMVTLGVQGVFIKPCNFDEMITKIKSVISSKSP